MLDNSFPFRISILLPGRVVNGPTRLESRNVDIPSYAPKAVIMGIYIRVMTKIQLVDSMIP